MNLKVDLDFKYVFFSASRDMLYASQICYLTAQCPFGWYKNRSERLVLLSSKQRWRFNVNSNISEWLCSWYEFKWLFILNFFDCSVQFSKFCHNSAIRCTELYEYCQRLGNAEFIIPAFQVQFTHYIYFLYSWWFSVALWLKVQQSNTALVKVKNFLMANQIKERGAYSSLEAQNIHWP